MLGTSHIASGILAWGIAYPIYLETTQTAPNLTALIGGAVITAAAALLPDADHPQGTIANTYGPVSKFVTRLICAISGGHRGGTHSLLFVLLIGLIAWFSPPIVHAVLFGLLAGILVRGTGLFPKGIAQRFKALTATTVAIAVGVLVSLNPPGEWFTWALVVGVFTHLLGDTITPGGVPYLFPLRTKFRIPLLTATGNIVETAVLAPLMAIGGIGLLIWLAF
jgi:membrane-bound metal-dependent hydrolase YbcI (DUF457 family)